VSYPNPNSTVILISGGKDKEAKPRKPAKTKSNQDQDTDDAYQPITKPSKNKLGKTSPNAVMTPKVLSFKEQIQASHNPNSFTLTSTVLTATRPLKG